MRRSDRTTEGPQKPDHFSRNAKFCLNSKTVSTPGNITWWLRVGGASGSRPFKSSRSQPRGSSHSETRPRRVLLARIMQEP